IVGARIHLCRGERGVRAGLLPLDDGRPVDPDAGVVERVTALVSVEEEDAVVLGPVRARAEVERVDPERRLLREVLPAISRHQTEDVLRVIAVVGVERVRLAYAVANPPIDAAA